MNKRQWIRDFLTVSFATALIGAATCCYVRAGLGSDAVAIFNEGLSAFTNLSLGTASWLLNIGLLLTAFLTARKYIAWTTICNSLLCGLFIDLMNGILDPLLGFSNGLWFRVVLFAAGMLLVALACVLMMLRCPGMSVLDAITTGISQRLGTSYRAVRIVIDAFLMITGWLMGGVIGVGTVVAVVGTGPLIQFCYQLFKKC